MPTLSKEAEEGCTEVSRPPETRRRRWEVHREVPAHQPPRGGGPAGAELSPSPPGTFSKGKEGAFRHRVGKSPRVTCPPTPDSFYF